MSQRECAGFNWPPLSIPAEEPVSICPEAVSRAGQAIFDICVRLRPDIPGVIPVPARSPSVAEGVGQPAICAAPPINNSPLRSPPRLVCPPVIVLGVGQPARFACLGNWSRRCVPSALGAMSAPLSFQSRVVVVTHPDSRAASSIV